MNMIAAFLRKWRANEDGTIAIVFGLSLTAVILTSALAIDAARVHNIQSHVQEALDAAALSAAMVIDPDNYDEAKIQETARAFFNGQANIVKIHGATVSNFRAVASLPDRTVEAMADIRIKSMFGGIAGSREFIDFTPVSKSKYINRKLEVALVLDITGSMCSPCTKIDDLKAAAKEMIDTLYAARPGPGQVKVSLIPYSASVNAGADYFGDVANATGAVDTCVMERNGANAFTSDPPSAGSLFESTGSTPVRPGYSCPASPIVPLTDLSTLTARTAFKAAIDGMVPGGATAGHIGLAWGWYSLSPSWSSIWPVASQPKPYRDDVSKTIILMTDGMFNRAYWPTGTTLTDEQTVDAAVDGSSPNQALQLCSNIRDRSAEPHGPTIYTISFMAPASADELMQECAGVANAYTADNRAGLVSAFTDIVSRMNKLALTD